MVKDLDAETKLFIDLFIVFVVVFLLTLALSIRSRALDRLPMSM